MMGDSGKDLLVEDTGSTAKHPRGEAEATALKVCYIRLVRVLRIDRSLNNLHFVCCTQVLHLADWTLPDLSV